MSILKECGVVDVFVSNKEPNYNYYKEVCTICGRSGCQEFRILSKFDCHNLEALCKIPDNIKRVQLCMYLADIKIEGYMENYMMNIGLNLNDFNPEKVTFSNYPKFYQESCIYKIDPKYKNQYINFDITNLVSKWMDGSYKNYGITLFGVSEGGAVIFAGSRSEKRPYIKVYYDKKPEERPTPESSGEGNRCLKLSYGQFINNTGKIVKCKNFNVVVWNKACNVSGTEITDNCTRVKIDRKGIYQVDYGLNIKTGGRSCMFLVLNDMEIASSVVQTGCEGQLNSGYTILNIKKDCSTLMLAVRKSGLILSNIGNAAFLRIIRIE